MLPIILAAIQKFGEGAKQSAANDAAILQNKKDKIANDEQIRKSNLQQSLNVLPSSTTSMNAGKIDINALIDSTFNPELRNKKKSYNWMSMGGNNYGV